MQLQRNEMQKTHNPLMDYVQMSAEAEEKQPSKEDALFFIEESFERGICKQILRWSFFHVFL